MKFRTFKRHLREGTKNLYRNGWMTFASISAVAVMLFVVGAFILMIMNMNSLAASVENDVEIRVYIELTANEEQQRQLYEEIDALEQIESVEYLTRDEGLDQLIDSLEDGEVFESIRDENPLNDAFIVRAAHPQITESVALKIDEMDYVDKVNYGKDVIERLFAVTSFLRMGGVVLIIGMMFTAMFLIANTIKLTIVARKREIQIMKLVGATNSFIRWPFFIEGLLLGTIGAMFPIAIIGAGYYYLITNFGERLELLSFSLMPLFPHFWQVGALLLAIGAFIGIWGSMTSVRKFLKV